MISGYLDLLIPTLTTTGETLPVDGPLAGDLPRVSPGDLRIFGLDFSSILAGDDNIVSVESSTETYRGFDDQAALLLQGPCYLLGNVAVQKIGGDPGFQPGVTYRWLVTALTGFGEIRTAYAHIRCNPIF